MQVRLSPGVKLRPEKFGGTCYVPHRDDIFAADHEVFTLLCDIGSTWTEIATSLESAYRSLAALGLCETDPRTDEVSYSGPSLLGRFQEFPSIEEPLVVNCFSTAHCPLKCRYCHADDLMKEDFRKNEVDGPSADLANVAATAGMFSSLVAVVTGGDPLTRPGRAQFLIKELAAKRKAIVLDTSGVGDIEALLPLLRENRVHVRVSLDALSGANDEVRPINPRYVTKGTSSEWAKRTIVRCLENVIPVTVQTVVTTKNDQKDELFQLRDWLIGVGVKHWVLHVAVEAGKAREFEKRARNQSRQRHLLSDEKTVQGLLRRLHAEEVQKKRLDIRITDTNSRPNSVILIDSYGNLQTEGFAHIGKVQLFDAKSARPDLIRDNWAHIDRFGHAVRYLNWNRWLYPDDSIEDQCYAVPIPVRASEESKVIEKEAKYRVIDIAGLRAALVKGGWIASAEVLQTDEYFDTNNRYIEAHDLAIRVRSEDGQIKFAFKGPRTYEETSSSRVEIELSISSQDYRSELNDRGLSLTWVLEKRRTTYRHPNYKLVAVADEVPEIGWFVELEGSGEEAKAVLAIVGEYIGGSERSHYADLYRAFKEAEGLPLSQINGARFSHS
jgi:predicted adenylyl cyclase CyaB